MNAETIRDQLKLASFFLQYPDDVFYEMFVQYKDTLIDQIDDGLMPFFHYLQKTDRHTLCENYVHTFDFGQSVNLYLTYAKHGEERERGNALLELKKRYAQSGFNVIDQELPDYLPLMLEFAAMADSTIGMALLVQYISRMKDIHQGLQESESPYAVILNHIVSIITHWDQQNIKQEVGS